jgi:putative tricarboxylic transport membrane protein
MIMKQALQFTIRILLASLLRHHDQRQYSCPDTVQKGWVMGFLGLFPGDGRSRQLQDIPRYTFGIMELEGGIEVVPVLIGACGIPQIIQVLKDRQIVPNRSRMNRLVPLVGDIRSQLGQYRP